MGLLSALGKIGSLALDFVPGAAAAKDSVKLAKAITGGMSAAGDMGSVLGKQQQGAAQGKAAQATANQAQDRNALQLYQDQQNAQNQAGALDLQRQNFATQNRAQTAQQALIGQLLGGGLTPTQLGSGGRSGGLLASLNANPQALAALKLMGSQASTAQQTPLQFTGGQIVKAPTLSAVPQIDNGGILSTIANIGQLAGAAAPSLQEWLKNRQPTPVPTDVVPQGGG